MRYFVIVRRGGNSLNPSTNLFDLGGVVLYESTATTTAVGLLPPMRFSPQGKPLHRAYGYVTAVLYVSSCGLGWMSPGIRCSPAPGWQGGPEAVGLLLLKYLSLWCLVLRHQTKKIAHECLSSPAEADVLTNSPKSFPIVANDNNLTIEMTPVFWSALLGRPFRGVYVDTLYASSSLGSCVHNLQGIRKTRKVCGTLSGWWWSSFAPRFAWAR